jgi:hypothetical protein
MLSLLVSPKSCRFLRVPFENRDAENLLIFEIFLSETIELVEVLFTVDDCSSGRMMIQFELTSTNQFVSMLRQKFKGMPFFISSTLNDGQPFNLSSGLNCASGQNIFIWNGTGI